MFTYMNYCSSHGSVVGYDSPTRSRFQPFKGHTKKVTTRICISDVILHIYIYIIYNHILYIFIFVYSTLIAELLCHDCHSLGNKGLVTVVV